MRLRSPRPPCAGPPPHSLPHRTARNSRPIEVIGTYDPIPKRDLYDTSGKLHKDIKLDMTRAKYWIGVGAQPTDTVWRLLSMVSREGEYATAGRGKGKYVDRTNPSLQVGILEPKYRPSAPRNKDSEPQSDKS